MFCLCFGKRFFRARTFWGRTSPSSSFWKQGWKKVLAQLPVRVGQSFPSCDLALCWRTCRLWPWPETRLIQSQSSISSFQITFLLFFHLSYLVFIWNFTWMPLASSSLPNNVLSIDSSDDYPKGKSWVETSLSKTMSYFTSPFLSP